MTEPPDDSGDWFELVPGHWMNKRLMEKLFRQWGFPNEDIEEDYGWK